MALVGDTGWIQKSNGQSDTLDLTGKYLISATVQWRGVRENGTTEVVNVNSKSGQLSGNSSTTTTVAIPGLPADTYFYKNELSVSITGGGRCCCAWPSESGCFVQYGGDEKTSSVRVTGNAKYKIEKYWLEWHEPIPGHHYTGNWYARARTIGRIYLYTENPAIKINNVTTSQSGKIKSGDTSAKKVDGLQSNAINTLTHSCRARYDGLTGGSPDGSSGKLQYRIQYTYIQYADILTLLPQDIGHSSARLRGQVEVPGGGNLAHFFQYGTESYTDEVEAEVDDLGRYYAELSDLEVNTLYQYRFKVVSTLQSSYHGSTWTLTSYGEGRSFETFAGAPSITTLPATDIGPTAVRLHGRVESTGGIIPQRYFELGKTPAYGQVVDCSTGDVGEYHADVTGLDFDTDYYYRAYAISGDDLRGNGQQGRFRTLYPSLPPPSDLTPVAGRETAERRPYFSFVLRADPDGVNGADKLHARVRISQSVDVEGQHYLVSESRFNDGWEAFIGDEWTEFPPAGVDPDTLVRVRTKELKFGTNYWDASSFDGDWLPPGRYGYNSAPRLLRLSLTVGEGRHYQLYIDGQEWYVLDALKVTESATGEIGTIEFVLDNTKSENLLTENMSSVEEDTAGFSALSGTISRSYDYALHGDAALKVVPAANLGEVELVAAEVEPGFYTATASILSAAAPEADSTGDSGVFRLRLIELDADDTVIGHTDSPLYGGLRGWQRLQVTREMTEDAAKAVLQVRGVKSPALDVFYLDCLQLEPGDRATAWKMGGSEIYADGIPYGAQVALAVKDTMNNSEEFLGRVREKKPQGEDLHVTAILGDGFLGERLVKTDYPTEDIAKQILHFEGSDEGMALITEAGADAWRESQDSADVMCVGGDLTLQSVHDYHWYDDGAEGVAWTGGYSVGGGTRTKEDDHLFIDCRDLIYDGGVKAFVSDVAINVTDIAKIKVDFSVIVGPEIRFGSVKWGLGVNKLDDGFVLSRSRSTDLGRTIWELDTSALTGDHYLKIICGAEAASNIATRVYRFWGEDENGRTVAEYEHEGYRISPPLDLGVVAEAYRSRIIWDAAVPTGTALTVKCGITNSDTAEPDVWLEAVNGDPVPGITLTEDGTPGDDLSGQFLWIKVEFTANLSNTLSPALAYLHAIVYDVDYFGVLIECPEHGYSQGDVVYIEGENPYGGVWEIGVLDPDTIYIDTMFEEFIGARGTAKLVEDVGLYFRRMVNDFCAPLTADDYVDTDTGIKTPLKSYARYVVDVAEDIRRLYNLQYFVDANYRVHLYKAEDIEEPDPYFYVRAGESKYLRGDK